MNIDEAAQFLGLAKKTLYNYVSAGKIPCYKPGGRLVFFKREELEEFAFRNRHAADYELNERAAAILNHEQPGGPGGKIG
jgi:excisionase family DNA binding protein